MLSKEQLEFIKASMCAPQAAVPTANEGAVARLFLSTLDEVNAQLNEICAERPALKLPNSDAVKT